MKVCLTLFMVTVSCTLKTVFIGMKLGPRTRLSALTLIYRTLFFKFLLSNTNTICLCFSNPYNSKKQKQLFHIFIVIIIIITIEVDGDCPLEVDDSITVERWKSCVLLLGDCSGLRVFTQSVIAWCWGRVRCWGTR